MTAPDPAALHAEVGRVVTRALVAAAVALGLGVIAVAVAYCACIEAGLDDEAHGRDEEDQ